MTQKSFLQNFLVRVSSFLAVIFLAVGAIFLFAAYFGLTANYLVGLLLNLAGVVLTVVSLTAANAANARLAGEFKEAAPLAHQLSNGEISGEIFDDEPEDAGELKFSLVQTLRYLKEKSAIADQIATGDLSAEIVLRSGADRFGESFQNMIARLRGLVQTEEERDRLQKAIMKLLAEVSEVAAGDLTVRADVVPEVTGAIAEAFNRMTAELRSLIGQVKDVTFQVGASASAISETTEQLARGSEAQASQISLTTAAVSNMAAQIQEVSQNASLSAQVATDSLNNARSGKQAVLDNIDAMDAIRKQVQETAKRIKKLGERSQEISQTVQLIGDLADRTSLLALNASLQAAAAGEAGRGFAVVAEEVERLAERSNRLTQQIASLTQTIQSETKDVVASMEETIHEVVVGSTLADKAGRALVEIEQVSGRLAGLIGSISDSTGRQAESSEDISKAMANISKVTELVNVSSKRAADSVKLLVALADELRGAVAPFKLPDENKARRRNLPEADRVYLN